MGLDYRKNFRIKKLVGYQIILIKNEILQNKVLINSNHNFIRNMTVPIALE
jgi:hypothetical protein